MTAVEKYFFTPLYYPKSAWSVLRWWEARRPVYNLVVGTTGLATLGVASLVAGPPPAALLAGGVLVYGVMANICYTLGPVTDLVLRRTLGGRAPAVGPVLFRYGFAFAVGLTLVPIPLVLIGWVLRHLLG